MFRSLVIIAAIAFISLYLAEISDASPLSDRALSRGAVDFMANNNLALSGLKRRKRFVSSFGNMGRVGMMPLGGQRFVAAANDDDFGEQIAEQDK